ncbi:hypothetical protein BS78_05G258800 [Paspalum vaginatum]|nr:hypothetical protein BS78_05G258800 [Paspalum vaginatum]
MTQVPFPFTHTSSLSQCLSSWLHPPLLLLSPSRPPTSPAERLVPGRSGGSACPALTAPQRSLSQCLSSWLHPPLLLLSPSPPPTAAGWMVESRLWARTF